ncbi:putative FtsJ-like methyltransferase [Leptomonas seymouri]|uniref:Putative tRNA (cytidine(32)/guanosine(34)-2'-O)-methyltransferase n=1 Tax=Leptomonas seymouri TaxID=5684 RepID=A0A0N1HTF7_LEPSE|nr:putative FtsJ-like methyltransferase [Leptomonas seymouri]|eukprot:KPI84265.1 putative FtsJ-like methyltransferase [Leptomonas seymouri]
MGRASKDKRDVYYRKAKEEGYRARSAYKLLQIHEEFNILSPAEICTGAIDLCAAPGSWSQVLAQHFKTLAKSAATATSATASSSSSDPLPRPRVIAVDLQEMAPIEGVCMLQGDITSEATANEIIRLLNVPEDSIDAAAAAAPRGGPPPPPPSSSSSSSMSGSPRKADIVVCDGAPDVTGMHELDEYLQHHLLLAALHITTFILRPGGCFLTKMFRGPNTSFLVAKSEVFFRQVRVVKPKSSRNASMESFLLCQDFRLPHGYVPRFLESAPAASSGLASTAAITAAPDTLPPAQAETGDPLRTCGFTPEAPVYRYAVAAAGSSAAQQTPTATAGTLPNHVLAPFLSCGDLSGYDADMCYDRAANATVLEPVQPPLQAPYLTATATAAARAADTAATEVKEGETKKRMRVEGPS